MKVASRIILYIFGFFAIIAILNTFLSIAISAFYVFLNVAVDGISLALLFSGSSPELLNTLLSFSGIINPLYFILMLFTGGELSDEYIAVALILSIISSVLPLVITIVSSVVPIIITFITAIFAFIGAGKKPRKGIHIMNIVTGALCWYFANTMIGIGVVIGAVFGLISDKKLLRQEEERKQQELVVAAAQ